MMFLCLHSRRIIISLAKDELVPDNKGTILIAHSYPVLICLALYTYPYAPFPIHINSIRLLIKYSFW